MSRNGRTNANKTRGLTKGLGWVYVFMCEDKAKIKLGYSTDPESRLHDLSVTEELEWYWAIPASKSQEQALHKHFRRQHIRRETFALRDEIELWIRQLHGEPFTAKQPAEMVDAYAPPNWLPWEERWLPSAAEQLRMEFRMPWERARKAMPLDVARSVQTLRSDCDDWYTPPLYIEAARAVMGGVDLDPASSPKAQIHVRAANILTARENGLDHAWPGRIWLNPPYGGLQQQFVSHLLAQFDAGITEQAVICLNAHAVDTVWFQPLWRFPICFTHHRILFKGPNGEGGQNTGGTAFVYLGPNTQAFAEEFATFGPVVIAVIPANTTRATFYEEHDPWLGMVSA